MQGEAEAERGGLARATQTGQTPSSLLPSTRTHLGVGSELPRCPLCGFLEFKLEFQSIWLSPSQLLLTAYLRTQCLPRSEIAFSTVWWKS